MCVNEIFAMNIYHWILLTGYAIFIIAAIRIFISGLRKDISEDFSASRGSVTSGIVYSFTSGMSLLKKESAYLHLPTYAAGLIFHLGTFLSFAWLIIIFFDLLLPELFIDLSAYFLVLSGVCGIGIFIKRIVKKELRQMSNPDDFVSNILVTAFHLIMMMTLFTMISYHVIFIFSAILFFYMPLGKLRHSVYFFIARYQLGRFFGKRGVWPSKKIS